MSDLTVYTDLIGRVFSRVEQIRNDVLLFVCDDGSWCAFYHEQDCCESVFIHDICGDLADLEGSPMLMAEAVCGGGEPPSTDTESYAWTFYKFATVRGSVTVRWLGTSNGYYSEGVDYANALATAAKPWVERPPDDGVVRDYLWGGECRHQTIDECLDAMHLDASECRIAADVVTDFAGRVICRRVFTGEEADHDR